MLRQIISGGQNGADRAALLAARAVGYATGGWMPRGFLTLDGARPEMARMFGMQEHTRPHYPPRTRRNVQAADATLRFARHWHSPGERLTLKMLRQYGKPFFDIDIEAPPEPMVVIEWLLAQRVHILNIAGNTERTAPGIEAFVNEYVQTLLVRYRATTVRS